MSVDLGKVHKLTLDELSKYKSLNSDMLPEFMEYYNKNKNKFVKPQNNWKKPNHNHNHKHQPKQIEKKQTVVPLPPPKPQKSDNEKLYSEFRSILNKLTDINFDNLYNDLVSLGITERDHLVKLADLIFKKAIIDVEFSQLYAKLAKQLAGYYIIEVVTDPNITPESQVENKIEKKIYFRDLLISECQKMFNACIMYNPESDNNEIEISKYKAAGIMTFIGQLYNCEMLTNKIMNSCFLLLLMKVSSTNNTSNNLLIDCVSELTKSVGKMFIQKCKSETDIVFQKIDTLVKSGKLSPKDKFALMDLIDLKKSNKWN